MISVIIPFGGANKSRINGLHGTLKALGRQTFRDFEVILVQEKLKEHADLDVKVDKHIKIENKTNGLWNESWAYNVGARIGASGNKLLMMGGDFIFPRNYLEIINRFNVKGFVPWSKCYMLNELGTNEYLTGIPYGGLGRPEFLERTKTVSVACSAGGIVCFDKDYYWKELGGYHEDIFGWGKLDNEIAVRMAYTLGKLYMLNIEICHLFHTKEPESKVFPKSLDVLRSTAQNPQAAIDRLRRARLGNPLNPTLVGV